MLKVLHITSRADDARWLSRLSRGFWFVETAEPSPDPRVGESARAYDVVLVDPAGEGFNAFRALAAFAAVPSCPPVLAVTREVSVPFVRMAERFGASDYVSLPCDFSRLRERVERAVGTRTYGLPDWVRPPLAGAAAAGFVGDCPASRRLLETVARVAPSSDPVLILGDTGTGKDLVARMIHDNSPVSGGVCFAMNVACVPESLAESQLFGSARGGFTGATDRPGVFESAHGGTLFLDEIESLDPCVQPKLLRVLEDGEVRRVGSCAARKVSFRLVCAASGEIFSRVAAGLFRRDLFYRINVLRVELPPLREREGDIELLAARRLEGYRKRLSRASVEKLRAHGWPGNVRELHSCLARAANASEGDVIYPEEIRF